MHQLVTSHCASHSDRLGQQGQGVNAMFVHLELRLTWQKSPYYGVLEIRHRGLWGRVCNHEWSMKESVVACVHLGYPGAHKLLSSSEYTEDDLPQTTTSTWLTHVKCTGHEDTLSACRFPPMKSYSCGQDLHIGLLCQVGKIYTNVHVFH